MAEGINIDKGIIEQEINELSSKQQYSFMSQVINNITTISGKTNCESFFEEGDGVREAYNECILECIKELDDLWKVFAEVDDRAIV